MRLITGNEIRKSSGASSVSAAGVGVGVSSDSLIRSRSTDSADAPSST
jgi:hypothetical protein